MLKANATTRDTTLFITIEFNTAITVIDLLAFIACTVRLTTAVTAHPFDITARFMDTAAGIPIVDSDTALLTATDTDVRVESPSGLAFRIYRILEHSGQKNIQTAELMLAPLTRSESLCPGGCTAPPRTRYEPPFSICIAALPRVGRLPAPKQQAGKDHNAWAFCHCPIEGHSRFQVNAKDKYT